MNRRGTFALALPLIAATACLKPSDPVVLHVLRPLADAPKPPATLALALEILPVRLPELLQRSQLVVAQTPERLGLSEIHHWGNPLEKEIQRVLAENLGTLLGSDSIACAPSGSRAKATHRLELNLEHLEGEPGGVLILQGTWSLTPVAGGPPSFHRVRLQESVPGKDLDALVSAHSRILARLAEEIAGELKKVAIPAN